MMDRVISFRSRLFPLLILLIVVMWFSTGRNHPASTHSFDVNNVSVSDAKALLDAGALVIDVREQDKFNARHIPGALLVPLAILRLGIPASLSSPKDRPVLVYCDDGVSSGPESADLLTKGGFTHVANLESGFEGWDRAGFPVERVN
jgi:rhodanese-related sulfurtransferase